MERFTEWMSQLLKSVRTVSSRLSAGCLPLLPLSDIKRVRSGEAELFAMRSDTAGKEGVLSSF